MKKFTRRTLLKSLGIAGAVAGTGIGLFAAQRKLQPTWAELVEKAQHEDLTKAEAALLGSYMCRSHDGGRIMKSWAKLQTRIDNLFKVHPYIESKMVAARGVDPDVGVIFDADGRICFEPTYCDTFEGA